MTFVSFVVKKKPSGYEFDSDSDSDSDSDCDTDADAAKNGWLPSDEPALFQSILTRIRASTALHVSGVEPAMNGFTSISRIWRGW